MTQFSRRRFLSISAACAALPTASTAAPVAHWRGTALGAKASLRLEGLTDREAAPIFSAVQAELRRLEDIFSLYRPNSELSRLNRDGNLQFPALELLDVLSLCTTIHGASDSAFDPTIQPLWQALADGADPVECRQARSAIGWHSVSVQTNEIRLANPGISALTLNGIAQGAITDRIARLLRSQGFQDVLVDMGEIMALGQTHAGQSWKVGLAGPGGTVHSRISLRDRAVATSAPDGTLLHDGQGHILHPQSGTVHHRAVSVSAPSAAIADGLSTALCLIPRTRMDALLDHFPTAQIEMMI